MSNEVRLGWECEHVVAEKQVVVSGQSEVVLTGRVGSYSTVEVRGPEGSIPASGLPGRVEVWSRLPGPYTGRLRVEGPYGTAEGVARGLAADAAAADLSRQVLPDSGCLVASNRGRIGVVGRGRVLADGLGCSGEALSVLGWPRWHVSEQGDRLVFDQSVPGPGIVEVTYVSDVRYCPRCAGGAVENDARTSADPREPVMVQDSDLLVQQSLKWLLTKQGSAPARPWYGAKLWDLVGAKSSAGAEVEAVAEVRRVLSDLQQAQRAQARYQSLSDAERLSRVVSVQAQLDPKNPTRLPVQIQAETASGKPVVLRAVYAAPGTVARVQGVGGLGLAARGP